MLKTPLKAIHWIGYSLVLDAENLQIATMRERGHEQRAQEMVRRCNAYDELLAACKVAQKRMIELLETPGISGIASPMQHAELASTNAGLVVAITKAEETSHDRTS